MIRYLIFADLIGVKWYHVFLVYILLNTNDVDMFDIIQFLFFKISAETSLFMISFCCFEFHQFLLTTLSTPSFHFLQINIVLFLIQIHHRQHLMTCFWAICISSPGKYLFVYLCLFFYLSEEVLYIFYIFNHFPVVCLKNTFSQFKFFLSTTLMVSSLMQSCP